MCGVAAVLGTVDPAALEGALRAMRHRGPDGAGTWVSPDRRIGLGHTRLALVDPAGGAQPLASESGDVRAVVNGELYDEGARLALERAGHRFATGSDSELLVHLYEVHGLEVLGKLRGEFAFVLWDGLRGRMLAGRDRFGVKPLVWATHHGRLLLASEAKALFALGLPARVDLASLAAAACLQYLLPSRSPFLGVNTLPPGHLLVAGVGRSVEVRRWWDLDYPRRRTPRPDDEVVGAIRAAVHESVTLRVRGDAKVAVQLSGGVDSSAVAAVAAERGVRDAFVVAFPGADETANAGVTATGLGLRLHVVAAGPDVLLDVLPEAVRLAEGTAINAHLPAKYLLSRAVRAAGAKVVLTGEGADEVFGGYAHLRRDAWLADAGGDHALLARLDALEHADAGVRGVHVPHGAGLPFRCLPPPVPTFLAAKSVFGLRLRELLSPGVAAMLPDDPSSWLLADVAPDQLDGRHPVDRATWWWAKTALATSILRTLGDGTEMAHGVEGRPPLLDDRVFEVAKTLTPDQRVRGATTKWAFREAVRPWVGDAVADRQKHAFMAPAWSIPAFRDLLGDLLVDQPLFDRSAAERVLLGRRADGAEANVLDAMATWSATALLLIRTLGLSA